MRKALNCLGALALVSMLAACGSRDEPANEALANDMNAMMADSGPFGDAEMRMNEAMMAAVGVNAGDSWVRMMIEHHKGAVEMSRVLLAQNAPGDAARMAQQTIDKQSKEIADLEKLVATGNSDPASAQLYRPAATQMHEAMMAAKGADISETYLRKMLAHHKGAVATSDVALANGVTGAVRAQIEKTKADQQMEVDKVEAMLRGEPMMATSATTSAAKTDAPKVAPEPATPAKPAATKPKQPDSAPDPMAGHDMNNM